MKHHAPQLQNNMMLKDEVQKILNLERATLQKKSSQLRPTCKTCSLIDGLGQTNRKEIGENKKG